MPKRTPPKADGASKSRQINFRVTDDEYDQLAREALGKTTITDLIRGRLFGGGMRSHDALRQVAALHTVGLSLRQLAARTDISRPEVERAVEAAAAEIGRLARIIERDPS